MRKHFLNYEFDNITTSEQAYWLGFLFADGYNTEKYYVTVDLQAGDKDHLDSFKSFLFFPPGPKLTHCIRKAGHQSFLLAICSSQMCMNLKKLGMTKAKSFTLKPPIIDQSFVIPFILGYFDGDGCASLTSLPEGKKKYYLSFVGTEVLLVWIKEILHSFGIISGQVRKNGCNSVYLLTISNQESIILFERTLYTSAPIFLQRKHQKILEMISGFQKTFKKTSKYTGVSFDKSKNRWVATLKGKIGTFKTEEEAYGARLRAEISNNSKNS